MKEDIRARFAKLGNLPTPPAVARDILALARDPEADLGKVATAIGRDPGLAAKVLRMANSAVYASRRQTQNLRQALAVLGIDATLTVCLGFSLTAGLRSARGGSLDYPRFWRHSLLAALGARCVAEHAGGSHGEETFLAGLLQDLGMIAIERSEPGFYAPLPPDASHAERSAFERERLGADHAELGAFLLESWRLPEDLVSAVAASHTPTDLDLGSHPGFVARCVALGTDLAEAIGASDRLAALGSAFLHGERTLGLDRDTMAAIVERIKTLSSEIGQLFDTSLLDAEELLGLSEDAAQLLTERNVDAMHEIETLRQSATCLEARAAALDDSSRRDSLTGTFNRGCFDERAALAFSAARAEGRDLALFFIDLDHFKRVNDTHGHLAGDAVLKGVAGSIASVLRSDDLLARYGGEEFVVVLPATNARAACGLGTRILNALRQCQHVVGEVRLSVTASIGMAVHEAARPFESIEALVNAADQAAYAAKRAGRNRLVAHGTVALVAQTA